MSRVFAKRTECKPSKWQCIALTSKKAKTIPELAKYQNIVWSAFDLSSGEASALIDKHCLSKKAMQADRPNLRLNNTLAMSAIPQEVTIGNKSYLIVGGQAIPVVK